MKLQISGKVVAIQNPEIITDKFTKQSLWVEIPDGKFPQTLNIEFANASIEQLDKVLMGSDVMIEAYLKGRIWKEKCFTSISGVKLSIVGVANENGMVKQGEMKAWRDENFPDKNYSASGSKETDDLPF